VIPQGLKIAHTAYVAVLVPAYWHHYGLLNFLWFSDVALYEFSTNHPDDSAKD